MCYLLVCRILQKMESQKSLLYLESEIAPPTVCVAMMLPKLCEEGTALCTHRSA